MKKIYAAGVVLFLLVAVLAVLFLYAEPMGEAPDFFAEPSPVFLPREGRPPAPLGGPAGGFVLSVAPGVHDAPFDLYIKYPSLPEVAIYFTIDGTAPAPGESRYVERGGKTIQVAGRLPECGTIHVADRTGYWRYALLAAHSESWRWYAMPEGDVLQGTSFRFGGFIRGEAATAIKTATYIIAGDALSRFNHLPIIAVTAPYADFLYIYYHADRRDITVRRREFNYEFFVPGTAGYEGAFSLPGSSSLGGWGSRAMPQRTINVHLARGALDGVVEYPIFHGLDRLYRFRLHNGGNGFSWDFMRDAFAQRASAGLNVLFSDNQLAVKFINGEFWGFTSMREHTSNRQFVSTRTGIAPRNIAIVDRAAATYREGRADVVEEGDEALVLALYAEMTDFVRNHDMAGDYAAGRFFAEFFCEYNFMDYLIANTFFHNEDWPHNNVRLFRAVTPEENNPYADGRWRFILHDMDTAPAPGDSQYTQSRFAYLLALHPMVHEWELWLNYAFLVLNNPGFGQRFAQRARYVTARYFTPEVLLAQHAELYAQYGPLLPQMYARFVLRETVAGSLARFYAYHAQLATFLTYRAQHYIVILDDLFPQGATR
ncbi:MAG: CotH kinase family protein [Defluviitaleaceae bacterium]|nr:CotH kinase family protein [Defluviitaleaceae bacterium]MCL2239321.1 CotH kinase family protein [Defluviitaleaceae bacterium]